MSIIVDNKKSWWFPIIITVIVASALFLSCGILNMWWLLWIAPLPLILYSLYANRHSSFICAFFSYAIGNSLSLAFYYYHTIYPWHHGLLSIGLAAAALATIIVLNSLIIKKWRSTFVVFFLPLSMVIYYYILLLLTHGELFAIEAAFTQYHFLLFIQIVRLTGIWGVCFGLALFPNAIAICWYYRKDKKIWLPITIIITLFFATSLTYGIYVLHRPITKNSIRVATISHDPNSKSDFFANMQNEIAHPLTALTNYENDIMALPDQGIQFVLNPECSFNINHDSESAVINKVKTIAKNKHATLLFPMCEANTQKEQIANYMLAVSPTGATTAKYHKQHLVHPFEDAITPGTQLVTINYKDKQLGLAICHDIDFVNPAKEYGQNNVGLLFVPAGDFGVNKDGWWHARFALIAAIANGYSLVRSTSYGFLTISDYHGRIIAQKPSVLGKRVIAIGDVPISPHNTFYARHGDWFVYLSIAGLLLLLIGFYYINKPK